jgi:hypothetical protein
MLTLEIRILTNGKELSIERLPLDIAEAYRFEHDPQRSSWAARPDSDE